MRHRFPSVVILLAASLFVSAEVPTDSSVPRGTDPAGLVVHEWGTFTSVAGEDGAAVEWVPPNGPQDLPCFVHRVPSGIKGWLPATVRMETPVLYFYSPEERTVDVRVRFRHGHRDRVVSTGRRRAHHDRDGDAEESCARGHDRVEPGQSPAARRRRVSCRDERQPLLRRAQDRRVADRGRRRSARSSSSIAGSAISRLPLAATLAADGDVVVTSDRRRARPRRDALRKQGRSEPVRARRSTGGQTVTLESPARRARNIRCGPRSTRMLVANGLYEKEAAAMVETWRDSWFEEGTRLFYIVPQASIDAILPLDITPEASGDRARVRRANRAHHTGGCSRSQRGDREAGSRDDRQARALSPADSRAHRSRRARPLTRRCSRA